MSVTIIRSFPTGCDNRGEIASDSYEADVIFPKKQVVFRAYFGGGSFFHLTFPSTLTFSYFLCLLVEISPLFHQLFEDTIQPNNLMSS